MFSGRYDVADLGSAGMIIAAGPSLPASHVPAVSATTPSRVVEDVLAEVPDRAVVGLRVVVERDLLDAAVEIRDVLRDERLDAWPRAPLDDPRVGQERRLGLERLAVDVPFRIAERRSLIGNSGFVTLVGFENVGATRSTRRSSGANGNSTSRPRRYAPPSAAEPACSRSGRTGRMRARRTLAAPSSTRNA